MKKLILIVLAAALTLTLCACGAKKDAVSYTHLTLPTKA